MVKESFPKLEYDFDLKRGLHDKKGNDDNDLDTCFDFCDGGWTGVQGG
jgi:hypothetical protein